MQKAIKQWYVSPNPWSVSSQTTIKALTDVSARTNYPHKPEQHQCKKAIKQWYVSPNPWSVSSQTTIKALTDVSARTNYRHKPEQHQCKKIFISDTVTKYLRNFTSLVKSQANNQLPHLMTTTKHFKDEYRNSRMEFDHVYFWTDTVKDWKHLLKQDKYKEIIISSWQELVKRNQIVIYAYVIMPNHIHIVWKMRAPNGKEMPYASFNKYTSHAIQKDLKANHPNVLPYFKVDEYARQYRIWQRDPLAILMDSKHKVEQKINYIHHNPLQERWDLAKNPETYRWSSAEFYSSGKDEFNILTHYHDHF